MELLNNSLKSLMNALDIFVHLYPVDQVSYSIVRLDFVCYITVIKQI